LSSTTDETELFQRIEKELYTPVISDSLDSLGYRDNAMSHRIRPLREDFVFAGRARTLSWLDVYVPDPNPYKIEIEIMDKLRPGDVVVTSTDAALRNAPWGELMSTAARARGARAAVIDSCVRDVKKIFALNFPVFATAIAPLDSNGRGRVVAYDIPIRCGGVLVYPGDLVVGDYDGIAVIPKKVETQVLDLAFDKATKENRTRDELMRGKLLREVYDKYGVL
jgi:4-hydroxy-4-methyl-2-oxoglutarate aldolase